jgi:hypothetical protein
MARCKGGAQCNSFWPTPPTYIHAAQTIPTPPTRSIRGGLESSLLVVLQLAACRTSLQLSSAARSTSPAAASRISRFMSRVQYCKNPTLSKTQPKQLSTCYAVIGEFHQVEVGFSHLPASAAQRKNFSIFLLKWWICLRHYGRGRHHFFGVVANLRRERAE